MNSPLRIFVSSEQNDCLEERRALKKIVETDDAMQSAFSLVEQDSGIRSQDDPQQPLISAVDTCDIFIAFLGRRYGKPVDGTTSAIELEFRHARERGKVCLIFVEGLENFDREPQMQAFLRIVGAQLLYRRYTSINDLSRALIEALSPHIPEQAGRHGEPKKTRSVSIFFGKVPRNFLAGEASIIITPYSDGWNDFTLRTRFIYEVFGFKHLPNHQGRLHLAFLSNEEEWRSPATEIARRLKVSSGSTLAAADLPPFFTMHEDMDEYRSLVKKFGPKPTGELLSALNDLVASKASGRSPAWFERAVASLQFNMAFIRRSESFFAFHNAGTVLSGLKEEALGGISSHFHLSYKLPTFENPHVIEFGFDGSSELPRRIAVLIGKNGVGKSQTLSHFAKALLSDDPSLRDGGGDRPIVNRLVAVSSPGETYTTFPSPPPKPKIIYRRVYLSKRQSGASASGLGEVLVQLVRSDESIKAKTRWQLFSEIVSEVMPLEEIFIGARSVRLLRGVFEEKNGTPIPLTEMIKGGEQDRLERWARIDPSSDGCRFVDGKLLPLSSGQITFLRFAAQICLHIENGTMLLFDEPETHLHPNLIADFVRLLSRLLLETGSYAILATHSAYFVREVPRSQVIVLRTFENKTILAEQPRLKTLGADIGAISSFIFEERGHGELVKQLAEKLRGEGGAQTLRRLEEELPSETIMHLRHVLKSRGEE